MLNVFVIFQGFNEPYDLLGFLARQLNGILGDEVELRRFYLYLLVLKRLAHLKKILRSPPHVCSLARIRIYSPLRQNVTFLVGADDGLTMWVNRKKIHIDHQKGRWFPDEDKISAELNRGPNDLVLCVSYATGSQYGFSLRILNESGEAANDLKYLPATLD